MFSKLVDFNHKRTAREAVGFYIVFFLVDLFWIFGMGSLADQGMSENVPLVITVFLFPIPEIVLGILLLRGRKRYKHKENILLFIGALLLTKLIGGASGMIPLAYLSTKD